MSVLDKALPRVAPRSLRRAYGAHRTPSVRRVDNALGFVGAGALALLGGCATVDVQQVVARTNQDASAFTGGKLALALNDRERGELQKAAAALLAKPLLADDAVHLALINSPDVQALLAQRWAEAAAAAQSGRIPNPILTLERLRLPHETDIGRMLAFGLLDVLTLPQRQRGALARVEQVQLQLSSDVVDKITQARQAWVAAVAAHQSLVYAQQVKESAEASAELAQRMLAVGNFNKLQRARQQAFYADATTRLAMAQHAATGAREALVRALGLSDTQAKQIQLPARLPDLPKEARTPEDVGREASRGRLDIKMAQAALNAAVVAQGFGAIQSFTDIELSVIRNTSVERSDGARTHARGFEVALKLPLFDWGDLQRDAMNARALAALNHLEATTRAAGSDLRERYSAYRTTYDIAKHYRDEIVPLRKLIADENVLRYNGMIIGVFELLADAREQTTSVMAAIDALQQFWSADAALRASTVGRPTMARSVSALPPMGGGGDTDH
ncbi:MAG: TolC family protein [Casimicrobium sp.]